MIGTTMKAYATRQLAGLVIAGVLAGSLSVVATQIDARPSLSSSGSASVHTDHDATQTISGRASVVDGDTLVVSGTRVRLEGIDAPESGQSCRGHADETWNCGAAAARALQRMVTGQTVVCVRKGLDRYGRVLGICRVGNTDIAEQLVRRGLAWAFVKYSYTYAKTEGQARALRIGVWQAENQPPWDHRALKWDAAEDEAPAGCAIKGNVTANGHFYHMPWSPWYGKIRMDTARGKRWFCSEAEALAAGWRPAGSH